MHYQERLKKIFEINYDIYYILKYLNINGFFTIVTKHYHNQIGINY